MTPNRRRLLLIAIVLLILAAGAFLYWLFDGIASIEAVQARVAALGSWGPVGFILLYGIATIAGVPGGIFDVAGGALFGPVTGSVINLAGGTLGAALAFLVARYLAADWVRQREGPRMQMVMRYVELDGWQFVAFVRLVPVLPYTLVN